MREPGSAIEHAAVDSAAVAHCAGLPLLLPRPGLALGRRPLPRANWSSARSEKFAILLAGAWPGMHSPYLPASRYWAG